MKNFYRQSAVVAVFSMAINHPIYAQGYTAESDFFGEAPIVLTVSRMHKPLAQSPASVSVIDREMIRNSGARELADLMRMVPGFIVGHTDGLLHVITYQGMGQEYHRQMQVLIDGRSVFIPSFGGVPWTHLPLMIDDIERIEVTRGPNAVTYGSNAFLATINIITRNAAEDLGGKIALTQQMASTSSTNDVYVRFGNQLDSLDWRLSAGRESDTGYDNYRDSKTSEKLNLRTDFQTAENQFWTISLGINETQMETGTGELDDVARSPSNTNSYQNIKWEAISGPLQTTVKLTRTSNELTDPFVITGYPVDGTFTLRSEVDNGRSSERLDLEIYQNLKLNDSMALNYGASTRHDKVQSQFLFHDNEEHKQRTVNVFANTEWKPNESTTFDIGLLSEDPDRYDRQTSYRLAAIQAIGQHNLRFVSSTAIRFPVLWESEGEIAYDATFEQTLPFPFNALEQPFTAVVTWLNNDSIRPEKIESNEIGLFSEYFDRQFVTDFKLFRYTISDQITESDYGAVPPRYVSDTIPVLDQVVINENERYMYNAGETRVDGLEVSFNFNPKRDNYRIYGGVSKVNVHSFDVDLENSFPDSSSFLGGHIDFAKNHQVSATAYYVGEVSWLDRSRSIPSYKKLDMRYQYTIDRKKDIHIELIGYNLLDKYRDYRQGLYHEPRYLMQLSGRF